MMQTEWRRESLEIAQEIRRHAEAKASRRCSSRSPGCSTTAWSRRRSPDRARRSSSRTICRRWSTGSVATTRSWSTVWWRAAIPPRRASTIPPTRSRDARLDRAGQLIIVRVLDPDEAARQQDQLIELLVDAVEGGASIGFVLPLERGEAAAYWQGVTAGLRRAPRACGSPSSGTASRLGPARPGAAGEWPAPGGGDEADGAALAPPPRHRTIAPAGGVRSRAALRPHAAAARRAHRRSGGSPYRSRGFVRFGEVPRHALDPDGCGLAASSFYYLQLHPARSPGVRDGRSGTAGRAVAAPRALLCRRAARGLPTGRPGAPIRTAHQPDRG